MPTLPIPALLTKDEIKNRVHRLGRDIREALPGKEVTVVSVLTGSLVFTADLIRRFDSLKTQVEVVKASRTQKKGKRTTAIEWSLLQTESIRDRHVLLIDDIIDTGQTLHEVTQGILKMGPCSLQTAVLLRKKGAQLSQFTIKPNHIGFDIDNVFAVGYGLDYEGAYRNLSWIGIIQSP